MKGQFFVMATVIMIFTLMALIRYFYDFSDINLPRLKEISELNYIPYIKESLNSTVVSSAGDCDKLQDDINATKTFLEDEMIKRGINLNIIYQISCPPPNVLFNFTVKTSNLYTETVFTTGAVDEALIPATTIYHEYWNFNCNPDFWCAVIDHNSGDAEGEMHFDISSLSDHIITSAKICAYMYNAIGGSTRNYIEEIDSSICDTAPPISDVPPNVGFADIDTTYEWKCIDITAAMNSAVGAGKTNYYLRWWGDDINGATSPYRCYRGLDTNLNNCGGSNPSGAADCRPYLDVTYI